MSTPSYAVNFRGKKACPCLAKWLPVYERELLRRGVIKESIDIYQLIGGAAASAGTHASGGAFDIAQNSATALYVARQMGADATWRRTPAQGFTLHAHGVLRGCPHNSPAAYQIAAVDAGYNGLGRGGRGGKDDGPRPLSKRTWQQGIEWANKINKSRVQQARDLLTMALKLAVASGNSLRAKKIQDGLDALPEK